jgi:hypothetical protein
MCGAPDCRRCFPENFDSREEEEAAMERADYFRDKKKEKMYEKIST